MYSEQYAKSERSSVLVGILKSGRIGLVGLLCIWAVFSFGRDAAAQDSGAEDSPKAFKVACDQASEYSESFDGRAVLVMHRGRVVYERYKGWNKETPHMLASGTKSFTGVLAMFAVQDKLLSLDELVCETLTEWKTDKRKSQITVRHLLTLCSGLEPADAAFPTRGQGLQQLRGGLLAERQQRIQRQDQEKKLSDLATGNWFADAVKVPSKANAGEVFDYGPSHFYVFGELLNRKLLSQAEIPARSFEEYAKLRIFEPVGISIGRWGKDSAGNVNIPGGLSLTAREWAKFGQFILDKGSVRDASGNAKHLISEELLQQCFLPSTANPRYGLTWWLSGVQEVADTGGGDSGGGQDPSSGKIQGAVKGGTIRDRIRMGILNREAEIDDDSKELASEIYIAAGLGKQRLFVVPDKELVIVRFAEPTRAGNRFGNASFLKPILEAVAQSHVSPVPNETKDR